MNEHWKTAINIAIICTTIFVITIIICVASVVANCDRKVIRDQGVVKSIERICR